MLHLALKRINEKKGMRRIFIFDAQGFFCLVDKGVIKWTFYPTHFEAPFSRAAALRLKGNEERK